MSEAEEFLRFLIPFTPDLIDLYDHVQSGKNDPDYEQQIAMNIIRKAKDAQAKKEIG